MKALLYLLVSTLVLAGPTFTDNLLVPISMIAAPNVLSLAFSPQGDTLALGAGQEIVLVDPEHWTERTRLAGHERAIATVAFGPQDRLASGSWDKTLRLWDIATGETLHLLDRYCAYVSAAAISPDGTLLAAASLESQLAVGLIVWTCASTGRNLRTAILTMGARRTALGGGTAVDADWIRCLAFSPDGTLLASGADDKTVTLWDTTTYREVALLEGHAGAVHALAFSPDGTTLAAASWRSVDLWDTASRTRITSLGGHAREVRAVVYSPDGSLLATGGHDGTIRLWDTEEHVLLSVTNVLQPRTGVHAPRTQGILALAFCPEGSFLVSSGSDGVVRVWSVVEDGP